MRCSVTAQLVGWINGLVIVKAATATNGSILVVDTVLIPPDRTLPSLPLAVVASTGPDVRVVQVVNQPQASSTTSTDVDA